MHYMKDCWWML